MNPNKIKTYIFVPEGKYEEEFAVKAYHQLDAIREAARLMSCNTILYMYILGGFNIRHYVATIELDEEKIVLLE